MLEEVNHADSRYASDLCQGFKVTGEISLGGLGTPVAGGLLRKGKTADGYVPRLHDLHECCRDINVRSIKRAAAARPTCKQDCDLAWQVWTKTVDEMACGRAVAPTAVRDQS